MSYIVGKTCDNYMLPNENYSILKQWRALKDFHTGIPLGCPNSGGQRRKYTSLYTDMLYHRLCFFLLNLGKVYFQVRKHTLFIGNHSKRR